MLKATLPSGMVSNYDNAFVVHRAGNPHIAYPKDGRLYYAVWSGSRWNTQLVDPTQKIEFHVSLALDGEDHPHISYTPWNPIHGASLDVRSLDRQHVDRGNRGRWYLGWLLQLDRGLTARESPTSATSTILAASSNTLFAPRLAGRSR